MKKAEVKRLGKKCFKVLFFLFSILYSLFSVSYATTVSISGRQILVDGKLFTIKGVCYSPIPVGQGAVYNWSNDANTYSTDFPLIKAMGANTIRTYGPPTETAAMDAAYSNGLYVIMGYWVGHDQDFSVPAVRTAEKNNFISMVNTWKGHPAVLMWAFGNEVWPGGSGTEAQKWSAWYSLVNEVAQEAKNLEGTNYHPVTTINADTGTISRQSYGSADSSMTALGCWGVNLYLGQNFSDRFTEYKLASTKPLLISEWGCDAYNVTASYEDQTTQASYVENQWKEIEQNLSAKDSTKVCLGGTVFEWCDEWWKPNDTGSALFTHDTTTDWTSSYYSDPNMNEEWWGIVAQSPGTYTRTTRQAYLTLKTLWSGTSGPIPEPEPENLTGFVTGEVKNYPNPFRPGTGKTTIKINSGQNITPVVKIYDITGNFIRKLKDVISVGTGLYKVDWYGNDEDGNIVANGVYVCKVKLGSTVKYRKIIVLK